MIDRPKEFRYLHHDKTIFIEYEINKLQAMIPIDYFYNELTKTKILQKEYLVSIKEQDNGIQIGFSTKEDFILTWTDLLDITNSFN